MEIRNLVGVDLQELTNCFNEAFANYFVEVHATEDYLRNRWKAARVRYDLSCGVFDEGRIIAFIIHGVDKKNGRLTAHNVGTGVVPAARGQNLVGQMYTNMLPDLKAAGVTCCSLEVICENVRAIRAYEKVGLQIVKTLPCFRGTPMIQSTKLAGLNIRQTHSPDWDLYKSFQDYTPSWDNEISAIRTAGEQYAVFELCNASAVLGYAVINLANGYIPQFSIAKAFRRKGYGRMLFSGLSKHSPTLRVINVDQEAIAVVAFLEAMGLGQYLSQYEMQMFL